jgi:cytochrome c
MRLVLFSLLVLAAVGGGAALYFSAAPEAPTTARVAEPSPTTAEVASEAPEPTDAAMEDIVAEGRRVYAQRCAVCHQIVRDDGTTVVRGGGSGPNLHAMIGRPVGTVPDYNGYGDALIAAGEQGIVWTEAALADYLADPRAWLRETLGDGGARSRMAFRLRDEAARAAVAVYLAEQR